MISCHEDDVAVDLIIHNADIYTVDPNQPRAQACYFKRKIIFVGKSNKVLHEKPRYQGD
ncbi:MAG: hypothetical protein IPP37_14280 [Saprospiraceae bacterium]|nr:hypothetical protein [Saprospiraceae bacterium]